MIAVYRVLLGLLPLALHSDNGSSCVTSTLTAASTDPVHSIAVDEATLHGISWGPCLHIDNTTQAFHTLDCGTLVVPLDHDHPPLPFQYNSSNSVILGMARLRALTFPYTAPTCSDLPFKRRSLILNPGGPGGISSFSLLRQLQLESTSPTARGIVSPALRKHYDLIGLDPSHRAESGVEV
jgi:hypothetical protein